MERFWYAGEPGQRTWVCMRELWEAPVEEGGHVARAVKIASVRGCQHVAEWVLSTFGRQREQVWPQGRPSRFVGESGEVLVGVVVASVAALLPLKILADLVNIGTLFAFVIVCAAVLIMRYTRPDVRRPFRTPLIPWVPVLGMLANLTLMVYLGWHNCLRLVVWLLIGLAIYWLYGSRHSHLARHQVRRP